MACPAFELTPPPPDPPKARLSRRAPRFHLRNVLMEISSNKRIEACGRYPLSKNGGAVMIRRRPAGDGCGHVAHFANLQTCGTVWLCPVCGPKIRHGRALELDQAAATWLEQHGSGTVLLLTLTLPHDAGEQLQDVLSATRRAFSRLVSGRAWQLDKLTFGLAHYARAHDVTHGPNGWHPHLHILLFASTRLDSCTLEMLRLRLYARWAGAVKCLERRIPLAEYGVSLEMAVNRGQVAQYVCQVVIGEGSDLRGVALELTRTDLKTSRVAGHRTPWQILADIGAFHETRDLALWREWELTIKGVHAIRWSRGLRAAVGLTALEATDEELAAQEIGGEDVLEIPRHRWRRLMYRTEAQLQLLEAAEQGGTLAARRLLDRLTPPGYGRTAETRAVFSG